MNREIKFRGKSIYGEGWLYGSLVKIEEDIYAIIPYLNDIETWKSISMYEVHPETVGQFTGLCDKDGKEIYEGDIINFTFYSDMAGHAHLENRPEIIRPQIVEFYDCRFVLHDFTLDKENVTYFTFHFSDNFRHRYEVAGNIYDTTELLKGCSHE